MLEIKNITKSFSKDEPKILKKVNLSINEGEFIAIVGNSGSGKTTLMNIIGGLTSPTDGEVLYNYKNIHHSKHLNNYRRDTIGFVFQDFYLEEHETVFENIEMPMMFAKVNILKRKKRIKEVLKKVELEDKINAKISTLSGGEKQRVAIARALVNNPKIILADEPTGNLDAKNSEEVISLLKKLTKLNYTVILVTHDKLQSYQADKIYEMKKGVLKEISLNLNTTLIKSKEDLISYIDSLNPNELEMLLNNINLVSTLEEPKEDIKEDVEGTVEEILEEDTGIVSDEEIKRKLLEDLSVPTNSEETKEESNPQKEETLKEESEEKCH